MYSFWWNKDFQTYTPRVDRSTWTTKVVGNSELQPPLSPPLMKMIMMMIMTMSAAEIIGVTRQQLNAARKSVSWVTVLRRRDASICYRPTRHRRGTQACQLRICRNQPWRSAWQTHRQIAGPPWRSHPFTFLLTVSSSRAKNWNITYNNGAILAGVTDSIHSRQ